MNADGRGIEDRKSGFFEFLDAAGSFVLVVLWDNTYRPGVSQKLGIPEMAPRQLAV